MNKFIISLSILFFFLFSCSSDDDIKLEDRKIIINLNHKWNNTSVSKSDFNILKFTNQNDDQVSIERYRYVLSDIKLIDTNGNKTLLSDYLLIDLGKDQNLSFSLEKIILEGIYSLNFTFGFSDDNNKDGEYADLNSANFNVPSSLGGGYHYMQFDGKYINSTTPTPSGFNYHAIRAVNNSNPNNLIFQDTSFTVNLANIEINNNKATITINVNIAEWFKSPNRWDLNILNQMLMPNFDAQLLINANGESVFSLDDEL